MHEPVTLNDSDEVAPAEALGRVAGLGHSPMRIDLTESLAKRLSWRQA